MLLLLRARYGVLRSVEFTVSSEASTVFIYIVVVSLLSHVRLFWEPMDGSPPGSSVHRISQARILEWVAIFLQGIFLTQGSN